MATDSLTVTVNDADGNAVFSKSGVAIGSTTIILLDANNTPLQVPLSGPHTITLTTLANVDIALPNSVALLIDT